MAEGDIEPRPGIFWRVDDPEKTRPGTLIRADGEWELTLHGGLSMRSGDADGLALVEPVVIYGIAGERAYTLRHAYWRSGAVGPFDDDNDTGQLDRTQRWIGYELIEDLQLPDDARLRTVSFELGGLGDFWRVSGIGGRGFDRGAYVPPAPLQATWRNASISVEMGLESRTGWRHRSVTETPRVVVTDHNGFTLEHLQRDVEMPLRALLSVCLNRPVEALNLSLIVHDDHQPSGAAGSQDGGDGFEPPLPPGKVDPGVGVHDVPSRHAPAHRSKLTADIVDFATLVPAWLELAAQTLMPMGSALIRTGDTLAPLQHQVVAEVNAAETLHRALNPATADTSFAERVKAHLSEHRGELNSRERNRVVGALKHIDEPVLEQRLRDLAHSLGHEAAAWLLGGHVNEWAVAAATMRNALAHGFPTAHQVETDVGAMAAVHATVKAITHLAMLTHCGLRTGQPLVDLLADDPRFRATAHQKLADWAVLAARIRATQPSAASPGTGTPV